MNKKLAIITCVLLVVLFGLSAFYQYYWMPKEESALEKISLVQQQQDLLLEQRKALEEAQEKLEEKSSKPDLSSIIAQWRPRIAYITCGFYFDTYGSYAWNAGSGVASQWSDGSISFLTNRHVVVNNDTGYAANECRITLSGSNETYTVINTYPNPDNPIRASSASSDWGMLNIISPDSYLRSITSPVFNRCVRKASVGDEIVILGYPYIGALADITATRGIISGYDGDYYITDAKIEEGNSGGAAILLKDGCYLGIPTYVVIGKLESLARILDSRVIWDLKE
jgi:hypothetical protein